MEPPSLADLRVARDLLRHDGARPLASVANAIDAVLAGVDAREALGLKRAAGHRSAFTVERIGMRDHLLRQIAVRHFPGRSISEQARLVSAAAEAYWRRAARLDRQLDQMPASYADTPRAILFQIVHLGTEMPSERTVRAVLSRGRSLASADNEARLFPANGSGQ